MVGLLLGSWAPRFMQSDAKRLRYWLGRSSIVAALALTGCVNGLSGVAGQRELLQPWIEVNGAQISKRSGVLNTDYVVLGRPASISVSGDELYLIDAGLRRIFRYDRIRQTLAPFAENVPVEAGMNILAAEDLSVYITSPSSGKILHFTRDGFPLPSFASPGNLARPISVALDERSGRVLAVDGLYNQLVIFNAAGGVLGIIKLPHVQSISAVASGPDGIYAIDRIARQVVVMGWDGRVHYVFGKDSASQPGSIAVSRDNLVFLGDDFDNTVRVYSLHESKAALVGKIGGTDSVTAQYNGIGGLAVGDDMLYVADSLNARIQTLLINRNAINSVYID